MSRDMVNGSRGMQLDDLESRSEILAFLDSSQQCRGYARRGWLVTPRMSPGCSIR